MSAQRPVLAGLNPLELQPGRRIASPQVLAALAMIGAFAHSPMAGLADLRRVDVSSPGVVMVTTGQGSEITFAWKIWRNSWGAGGRFTIWERA